MVATAQIGQAGVVGGYILFAIAAALAVFMLAFWANQRFKRRGSQRGRRY